ncbi:MAG TPA: LysM peptidoglycan-binding domain-containing protein [Ruminiclostridium sp.]|nr:LysM peptidoglycan-binding domain-containing protein [Ruminiclostridium sp.]
MEFWLSFNNRQEVLQLPVPPEEYQITTGRTVNVLDVNSLGEIALIGKNKLSEIEIKSFFPLRQYSFCQYKGFPLPYECVKRISKWKDSGRPIRLVITGTNINLPCVIETFEYGEKDGSGDVYFTINLKEYRFIQNPGSSPASNTKRAAEKQTPRKYTVKSGDTLWAIAKRFYGDGSKYPLLAQKNKIKDPNRIYTGQVLVV